MALTFEAKQAIVSRESQVAADAISLVTADYRGTTVAEMTELRRAAREKNVYLRVIPKRLALRAFEGTQFACVDSKALEGPNVFAFSMEEPGAAARLLKEYSKNFENLTVKMLAIDGEVLPASQLDAVASLPTRDEARAMLMRVMNAPIEKLVRTKAAPHTQFVRTLAAVGDSK